VQTDPATGAPRFRVDGIAKVTGEKVFARDIRARDMPHWPAQQSHAFIVRTTRADRTFDGIDLSLLGDELKPDVVVTAADLERDGVTFPKFYGDDMLLPVGKTPAYLGHAVAILIYHDFARFRFAKDKLKFATRSCAMAPRLARLNAIPGARSVSCAWAAPRRSTTTCSRA
jgi:CO/xanthine dehydrogenase Mo-binding subunit